MNETEKRQFEEMKQKLEMLERVFEVKGNRIYLKKTVVIDGALNADKLFTQRSGSYVELTT